jgi:hypothetical protein
VGVHLQLSGAAIHPAAVDARRASRPWAVVRVRRQARSPNWTCTSERRNVVKEVTLCSTWLGRVLGRKSGRDGLEDAVDRR